MKLEVDLSTWKRDVSFKFSLRALIIDLSMNLYFAYQKPNLDFNTKSE